MSTTITIPAQLVKHVRAGATWDLGQAAGDILGQSERKGGDLQEPLRRFDAMRAVLDSLPSDETPAHVEPALVPAMVEALRWHARALNGVTETARQEGDANLAGECQAELDELEAGLNDLLSVGA